MAKKDIGTFHPRRINQWYSDAKYAADVDAMHGTFRVTIRNPAAGASTAIISGVVASAASGSSTLATAYQIDAEFGRVLSVNGTVGATTGATSTVTLYGLDYLGQPMGETVTMNGTTAVNTLKAFKWLTNFAFGVTGSGTISIGTGNGLGVPYLTRALVTSFTSQVKDPTQATLTAGVTSAAQSLTSADPRGTIANTSQAPNGSRVFEYILIADVENNIYGNAHVTA